MIFTRRIEFTIFFLFCFVSQLPNIHSTLCPVGGGYAPFMLVSQRPLNTRIRSSRRAKLAEIFCFCFKTKYLQGFRSITNQFLKKVKVMHSDHQEEHKSVKTEFIEDYSEVKSDPEPIRVKHEDTEEPKGWCLLLILR